MTTPEQAADILRMKENYDRLYQNYTRLLETNSAMHGEIQANRVEVAELHTIIKRLQDELATTNKR